MKRRWWRTERLASAVSGTCCRGPVRQQFEGQVRRLGIERTFSLQKQRHGLGRTRFRGGNRVRGGVYLNVLVVNVRRIMKLLVGQERTEEWQGAGLKLLSRAA